ncbi:MAG: type II secretion system protein GspN [Woeseiaceae bacterium]|nr:type II secretion system protein GspN [Woeseiaceae bacterium]NIP20363.1 type II secretion system protein GspN [Woeseiaceae bacterium]NIS89253.1 type II secretion system protein GspN [Woeseiaceae bacterium]
MIARYRYVVIGLITLVVGLVALFPARVAYHWFAPPGIAISGIDGTVWHGRADAAVTSGLYVSNLDWTMRPLALFTGKIGYGIEAEAPSGFLKADVTLGAGGHIALSDLTASVSLESLQQVVRMPGLTGTMNLRFDRLNLENGLPVAADGIVEISNLRAPIVNRAPIGGFRAEFFTQETGVVASVEDTNAKLELAGSLSISPDRSYEFIGLVAPKDDTPADMREQMRFLGTANERGQYEVRLQGRL